MEPLIHPVFTELFGFCYLLYFVYLAASQAWYFFGDLQVLKRFYVGLFSAYGVAYFGYVLVPALGPAVAMPDQFTVPLEGLWLTGLNAQLLPVISNPLGTFPSLHCGLSLYILMFDYRHKRWRFWLYLVPCVGFWISTIYLRHHYFIDVVAGFALSFVALWLSGRAQGNGAEPQREVHANGTRL